MHRQRMAYIVRSKGRLVEEHLFGMHDGVRVCGYIYGCKMHEYRTDNSYNNIVCYTGENGTQANDIHHSRFEPISKFQNNTGECVPGFKKCR